MDAVKYYTEVGPDYILWSRNFNMHFGFWRPGMNPFDREAMLEQMNREVFARGRLETGAPTQVLDLGCGAGAVARSAARHFPGAKVTGITLVPCQVRQAIRSTQRDLAHRVLFVVGDYICTPFRSSAFDLAYALESSCYAPGLDKCSLIQEVRRVLRPGGRFVIADAMLRGYPIRNPVTEIAAQTLCHGWKLPALGVVDKVVGSLKEFGFIDINVEDIGWNVTPSILHSPAVSLSFFVRQLNSLPLTLSRLRLENALMWLPLFIFSLDRSAASYFIVSGTRS